MPQSEPELPFVGLDAIFPNSMKVAETVPLGKMKSLGSRFRTGDVLYGRLRPYLNKVWHADHDGACSGELLVLRPSGALDPKFLTYRLHSHEFVDFASHTVAGDRPRLDFKQLAAFKTALPPIETQRRIVARIDELFSELDDGEEELAQAQAELKRATASLCHAAFTGRLTANWRDREGNEEQAATLLVEVGVERRALWDATVNKRGRQYSDPPGPDSRVLSLPITWEEVRMEQLGLVESGQTPKGIEELIADAGEVPWFKVSSMNVEGNEQSLSSSSWWLTREDARSLGLRVRPAGTIVFPKRGGAIFTNKKRRLARPGAYDLNVMGFIATPSVREYCWHYFRHLDLSTISDGSNVPQINYFDVADLVLGLPPARELTVVTDELLRGLAGIDELETELAEALNSSSTLRQSILAAAFRGELVQ